MKGTATHYLNQKTPSPTDTPVVPIYVRRSQFRLPYKSKVPIIMVGPGTGLAPFVGFIQDRAVAKNAGKMDLPANPTNQQLFSRKAIWRNDHVFRLPQTDGGFHLRR